MSHSVYDYVEDSTDYNSVVTEHSRKTLCENTILPLLHVSSLVNPWMSFY